MAADNDFTLGRDYLRQLEDARSLSNNLADEFMQMNNISASTKQKMKDITDSMKGQADISDQITHIIQAREQYIKDEVAAGRAIEESALNQLDTQLKRLKDLEKQKKLEAEIKEQMEDTNKTIIEMLGGSKEMADIFRTGGILAAGVKAFENSTQAISDAFSTTFGTAFDMYKTMGISGKEGAILAGEIGKARVSMAGLLYDGEDFAEASKALVDQYGNVNMATSDMVEGVTEINALVGDAAKSVDLALAFQNAGVAANEVDDVLKDIGSKTGVTATKIAKEMADNQFLMLGASKQQLSLIAKHNAALVKQGQSRKDILSSAQGVLDIENTINGANKLALLTGKQMNVSELMSAALAVDTVEGVENKAEAEQKYADLLRKQVDSMGGIEGMSEINKRNLLDTLKIDEERLIQMYNANTAQEHNNKLTEEGSAFWGALTAGAISFGAGIGSATLELIKMIAQAMIFNKVMTGNFGMRNLRFGGGGGPGPAPPTPPPTPPGPPGPPNPTGGINATSLLKGAAALLLMAAALFVFAKALQEMKDVGLREIGMAFASVLVMAAGLAILGTLSGPIITGALALLIMASALLVFGYALQSIAAGVGMLAELPAILTPLAALAGGLALFGLALIPLQIGLIALAVGLLALKPVMPELLALVALGAGIALIANALGFGGGGSSETTSSDTKKSDPLLEEIRGLRADIKAQPINVVLNGKIVGEINKSSRAINSYVNK
jgi:hypothetical protein